MVVVLHFLNSTEGRIISPRTGSLAEDPNVGANLPIQSTELSPKLVINAHTNTVPTRAGWQLESLQIDKSKCHCRGGKSVPGKAAETQRRVKAAQNMGPFGGRLSYCVSCLQQGKVQESVAHPPKRPFSLHFPNFPSIVPECRPSIKCLREVMESVPGSFNELFA